MLVELKNGLKLSLPDDTPRPFPKQSGYFVLNGFPYDNPDLSITPAFLAICETLADAYELYQYEIVLGRTEDIV